MPQTTSPSDAKPARALSFRQRRRAAGLCVDCGAEPRTNPAGKRLAMCVPCFARRTAQKIALRERLLAGNRCVRCQQPARIVDGRVFTLCSACRAREMAHKARAAQAERDRVRGRPGVPPMAMGPKYALDGGKQKITVLLDWRTHMAFDELVRRDNRRIEQLPEPPSHNARVARTSRIVREAIRKVAHCRSLEPARVVMYLPMPVQPGLDAPTLATLDRLARASFGGNRSACLRTILRLAARPEPVLGRRPATYHYRADGVFVLGPDPWVD